MNRHVQKRAEKENLLKSSVDKDAETVLLLEWDIERFFSKNRTPKTANPQLAASQQTPSNPPSSSTSAPAAAAPSPPRVAAKQTVGDAIKRIDNQAMIRSKQFIDAERRRLEKDTVNLPCSEVKPPKSSFLSNLFENAKMHRRQDNDSKASLNFVRGFRREHSDFFPLSKRHSAILGERQIAAVAGGGNNNSAGTVGINSPSHRSSVIYPKNNKHNNGEPILTDFVSRQYLENSATATTTTTPTATTNNNQTNQSSLFMGPRRQKTESVILLRNSTNKNLLFEAQQVKTKHKPTQSSPKVQTNKRNENHILS